MFRGTTAVVTVIVALLIAPVAHGATANDVYRDYADNGKLDKQYSDRELQAVLKSPSVQVYGNPTVTPGLRSEVLNQLTSKSGSGTLPFTGLDLALLTVGGIALAIAGGFLHRVGRRRV